MENNTIRQNQVIMLRELKNAGGYNFPVSYAKFNELTLPKIVFNLNTPDLSPSYVLLIAEGLMEVVNTELDGLHYKITDRGIRFLEDEMVKEEDRDLARSISQSVITTNEGQVMAQKSLRYLNRAAMITQLAMVCLGILTLIMYLFQYFLYKEQLELQWRQFLQGTQSSSRSK